MEKKVEASVHELLQTIDQSRSGAGIREAVNQLRVIVASDSHSRNTLLSQKEMLGKIIRSTVARRAKKWSEATKKRFEEADGAIIDMLSDLEKEYGGSFPVFNAWLSLQRRRGIEIPVKTRTMEQTAEADRLNLSAKQEEVVRLKHEISQTHRELSELIETFTPDLERAFADLSDSSNIATSRAPEEIEGENDELFAEARQRFDYLTKKLIPRLNALVIELQTIPGGNNAGQEGSKFIESIQNSATYVNFLLLLSRSKRAKPNVKRTKRSSDEVDHEYDDWF